MDDPSKRAIDKLINAGSGNAFMRNQGAIDRLVNGGLTDALTRNQQIVNRVIHQGLPAAMQKNERVLDRLINGGFQDALQRNQQVIDRLVNGGGLSDALTRNQRVIDRLMAGGAQDTLTKNREVLDRILNDGVPDVLAQSQRVIDQLMQSPAFASAIGVEVAPRTIWEEAVREVSEAVGAEVSADVREEFDAAANASDATRAEGAGLWWIARLPIGVQAALATAIVNALVPLNDLLGDLDVGQASPGYLHAAQLLLALATVLIVFMNARAELEKSAEEEN